MVVLRFSQQPSLETEEVIAEFRGADKKETGSQISTFYKEGLQKSIS